MRYIIPILIILTIASCKPEVYTPKPRGYYEIALPERKYQSFDKPGFPYSFEYPVYAKIANDSMVHGTTEETPYWINIDFPSLGGRIYLSYKIISPNHGLDSLAQDAYKMTVTVHDKRADNIESFIFNNDSTHVHGLFYNVTGNAASAYQFYATDSVKNFIRGALYFDVSPNVDSLKPVNEFLRTDIEHILQTLRWK